MDLEDLIEELMKKKESELDVEVLRRKTDWFGTAVAHEMAERGYEFKDKEILKIANDYGWTVAHEMASAGYVFKDKEILKLANKYGWMVAHVMAARGHEFKDKEILKLADEDGWTVVHEMSKQGYKFKDKEILKLATKDGWMVAHEMVKQGYKLIDKEVLNGSTYKNAFQNGLRTLRYSGLLKKVDFTKGSFLKSERQNLKDYGVLKILSSISSKKKTTLKPYRR